MDTKVSDDTLHPHEFPYKDEESSSTESDEALSDLIVAENNDNSREQVEIQAQDAILIPTRVSLDDTMDNFQTKKNIQKSLWKPYYYLLKDNPYYRFLYFANVISRFGDSLNYIATLTVLDEYSSSGILLSLLLITRMAPRIIFFPFIGVICDRFDRKKLMMASDAGRIIVVLSFMIVQSESTLWLLYLLSFLQFCFGAVFEPSRSGLIPSIITKDEIVTANTLDGTTWSFMTAIASSAGGLIITFFGTDLAYLIDSSTYFISILLVLPLFFMQQPADRRSSLPTRQKSKEMNEENAPLIQNFRGNDDENEEENDDGENDGKHLGDDLGEVYIDVNGYPINPTGEDFLRSSAEIVIDPLEDYISGDDDDDDSIDRTISEFHIIIDEEQTAPSSSSGNNNNVDWNQQPTRTRSIINSDQAIELIRKNANQSLHMFVFGCIFLNLNKYVIAMSLLKGSSQFIEGSVNTLNIQFSQSVFEKQNSSSSSLGALYTVLGLSTFLGPVLAKRFGKETRLGTHAIFILGFFLLAFGTFALSFANNIWFFLIINAFRSSGTSIIWVFASSMLQKIVVDEYRGRTLAFDLGLSTSLQATGTLVTGVLSTIGFDPYSCCVVLAIFANSFFFFWMSYFSFYSHHYHRNITTPMKK